jgi:dihydrofolate synthase/folylpolyglutamate synthase
MGEHAARSAAEIAAIAEAEGIKAHIAADVSSALGQIAAVSWSVPPRILICGSLYLAGEVLAANGTPPE